MRFISVYTPYTEILKLAPKEIGKKITNFIRLLKSPQSSDYEKPTFRFSFLFFLLPFL